MTATPPKGDHEAVDVHERWEELLAVALLGTDRRDPPTGDSPIDDLVADCQRPTAAGRMLAQAAACVAVRRAAMTPAPPATQPAPAGPDPRPPCPQRAVVRWRHVISSWPVLEDEWLASVILGGWRIAPELVPTLMLRHRRDPTRLARVCHGAGPVAAWLAEVDDQLSGTLALLDDAVAVVADELPPLPIPADLDALRRAEGSVVADALVFGLRSGAFVAPHRPVLVNLLARVRASSLPEVIAALDSFDPIEPGAPVAASLGDLARTRRAMLMELQPTPDQTDSVTPAR